MRIAIAQLNPAVGDISGNTAKIVAAVEQARQAGASLIITPELALCGYPPADLLLREAFYKSCSNALTVLTQSVGDITLIVGHPDFRQDKLYNAASVIRNGSIQCTYHKRILNKSPFFNESYYFDSGIQPCIFELEGIRFGLQICADFWSNAPIDSIACDVLLVLSASAYHIDKQVSRYQITHRFIQQCGIAVIHANLTGGQDELVFDGASFVMNSQGELTHQCEEFTENIAIVELQNRQPLPSKLPPVPNPMASIYRALCLGVKDYVQKNGFPGVLLGLSGGVDSALVLAIAVDALGADKVTTVMMPTQYTAAISLEDAEEMAAILGVKHYQSNIESLFEQFLATAIQDFKLARDPASPGTMPENLQARIRGTLLMALSNQTGALLLTTGNKSEVAVGYCTLYGDMAGGFAVLKDVSKTLVYRLCEYRNQISSVIPQRIIDRPPSAELRPNQTDQDSLPPYDILDAIIEAYVEKNCSPAEIVAMHYSATDVAKVIRLIHMNEYKRRQSAPGIRITHCDFGTAWHYPVTSNYKAWSTLGIPVDPA